MSPSEAIPWIEIERIASRIGQIDVACPACGPDRRDPRNRVRRVLRVWRESDSASFSCARCGLKGLTRADRLAGARPVRRHVPPPPIPDDRPARIARARALWARRQPLEGTPAESYLREARGIRGPLPPTLGYLPPTLKHPNPALIAAFGIPGEPEPGVLALRDDAIMAVQVTALHLDGSAKADVDTPRLTFGAPKGSPLVVAHPGDGLGLAICEGLEDALSVHEATGLGAWASGGLSFMPALADTVPGFIEIVSVMAHPEPQAQAAANDLARRLRARGIEAVITTIAHLAEGRP